MICLLEFEISNHINCMCGGRWKGMPFNHNIPLQWIILHFPHWVVFELYHIKIGLPQCMLGWRLQKSPATSPPNLFFGTARHTDRRRMPLFHLISFSSQKKQETSRNHVFSIGFWWFSHGFPSPFRRRRWIGPRALSGMALKAALQSSSHAAKKPSSQPGVGCQWSV